MKTLTTLVFMAADNNLYRESIKDLNEMKKVGSNENLNVVVEIDRRAITQNDNPSTINELDSERLYIEKDHFEILKNLGEINTGDPIVLNDFLLWGISAYPAERYIAIVWNHGGGVKDEEIYEKFGRRMKRTMFRDERWIACDDTSGDFLDTIELKRALSICKRFEIIGFDACLMSMVEIIYQLRYCCNIVVGSQETEPSAGWPYHTILSTLSESPHLSPPELATVIVTSFQTYMTDAHHRTTLSAISTEKINALAKLIDDLAKVLIELMNKSLMSELEVTKVLRFPLQRFRDRDYIDLSHFAMICGQLINDNKIQQISSELIQTVKDIVIINAITGSLLDNAHGISIFFPSEPFKDEKIRNAYKDLDFTKDYPNWFNFIERYFPAR
jgi:hypothetical protein